MTDSKTLWSYAAYAGLILGLVSSAYYLCSWALGKYCTEGTMVVIGTATKVGLWIVKFVTCIMLMKTAMRRYVDFGCNGLPHSVSADTPGSWGSSDAADLRSRQSEVTNADTFRLGAAIALLSALVFAGFSLAFVLFIQPDIFEQAIDTLRDNPMMNDAAIEAVEAMAPKFPAITFFSTFIYCSLFGTILSAILSHNIPSTNPFSR